MREQQNPNTPDLHQPLLFAPSELLACGLRDAHHHPLVGERTEDGVRSWRTSPAMAWEHPLVEWARTARHKTQRTVWGAFRPTGDLFFPLKPFQRRFMARVWTVLGAALLGVAMGAAALPDDFRSEIHRAKVSGAGGGALRPTGILFFHSNRSSGALWRVSWRTSPARAWQWPLVEWLRAGNSYAARCPQVVAKTYSEVHAAMALILAGRVGWFSRPQRVDCLGVLPVPTSDDCRLGVALAFLRIPSLRCVSGDDSYGDENRYSTRRSCDGALGQRSPSRGILEAPRRARCPGHAPRLRSAVRLPSVPPSVARSVLHVARAPRRRAHVGRLIPLAARAPLAGVCAAVGQSARCRWRIADTNIY